MPEQRAYVDYRSGGDTGQNSDLSIQPVVTQEGATELTFRRPSENLRSRSEIIRGHLQDLFYYRDFGNCIFELTSGGTITWGGTLADGGTGIVTCTGTLKVSPILSPPIPIRGSLATGIPGNNQIVYTVSAATYASQGANSVTVEQRAVSGASLTVSISPGPVKRILLQYNPSNAAHTPAAAKTVLDQAVIADTELAGKLTITTSGTNIIAGTTEQALSGSVDDESHWIVGSLITTLTTSRKLGAGDGVAIWYKYVIEPTADPTDPKGAVAGGRAESSIARNNYNIPAGSLFVTSDNGSKIPGALPLLRVGFHGQLILADGTRLGKGESTSFASIGATVTAQLTPAINSALAAYNVSTITPERTTAINNALSSYNTSTIIPQRDSAINAALAAYNTSTIIPQRTTAIDSYNTNTIIPQRDAAIAAAMAGVSGGVSQAQVNTTIANYNTSTIIPQRDAAIQAAIAGLSSGTTPKSVTATFAVSSGADHNGATSVNNMLDATYPNGGRFFVGPGSYSINTFGGTTALRFVDTAPSSGTPNGYTVLSLANTLSGTVSLSGEYTGFEFATAGSAVFKVDGVLILKNCVINSAAWSISNGATLIMENVKVTGLRPSTGSGLIIPPNAMVECRNCVFDSPTGAAAAEGGIISIQGPCTTRTIRSFINCTFAAGTSNGASVNTHTIHITNENQGYNYTSFFNCGIQNNTTAGSCAVSIYNSVGIKFVNCAIRTFVGGMVLDQNIGAAHYDNCAFSTSDSVNVGNGIVAANSQMIQVRNSTWNATPGTRLDQSIDTGTYFKNCTVRIGEATRQSPAAQPIITLGGYVQGNDTTRAYGPIHVDGLHIVYSQPNKVAVAAAHLMVYGTGRPGDSINVIKNVTVDFNGCYRTGAVYWALVQFIGRYTSGGADFVDYNMAVENLNIANATCPGTAASTGGIVSFARTLAKNVVVSVVPSTVSPFPMTTAPIALEDSVVENLIVRGGEELLTTSAIIALTSYSLACAVRGGEIRGVANTNVIPSIVNLNSSCSLINFTMALITPYHTALKFIALTQYNLVQSCTISSAVSATDANLIDGGIRSRIIGNYFVPNTSSAARVDGGNGGLIVGNVFTNSGTAGVTVVGTATSAANYTKP